MRERERVGANKKEERRERGWGRPRCVVIHTQGSRKFSFEFKSRASSKNATMGSELLLNKRPSSSFLDPPDREADQPVKLKIVSKLYLRSTGLSSKAASKLFFSQTSKDKA